MFPDSEPEVHDRTRTLQSFARRAGLSAVPAPVLVGVCVLVAIAVGIGVWRAAAHPGGSHEFAFERAGEAPDGGHLDAPPGEMSPEGDPPPPSEPVSMWVHVAGSVMRPGLYEVAAGGRVGDAVAVAGGPIGDACVDAVNLARPLADGERIYVPTSEEVAAGGGLAELAPAGGAGDAGSGGAGGSGLIDLNLASEAELQTLPGVGPATATKIVADRESNGPFTSPEDLMRVSGIAEKKYEALRDLITVR